MKKTCKHECLVPIGDFLSVGCKSCGITWKGELVGPKGEPMKDTVEFVRYDGRTKLGYVTKMASVQYRLEGV
jgi:hypothetical protein